MRPAKQPSGNQEGFGCDLPQLMVLGLCPVGLDPLYNKSEFQLMCCACPW